jgi:hypothetical protein
MSLKHHRKTLLEMKRELLQVQETGDQAEQTVEPDQPVSGRGIYLIHPQTRRNIQTILAYALK